MTSKPNRPPRPAPQPLGTVMGELIRSAGWAKRLEGARVHEHWEAIAGPALAQRVRPVRLLGGVLVVRVSDPAWATEVRSLSGELAARANDLLGPDSVTQVQVLSGADPQDPRQSR